jgi:dihydroorotate dehydrogenase electron transfer subunit
MQEIDAGGAIKKTKPGDIPAEIHSTEWIARDIREIRLKLGKTSGYRGTAPISPILPFSPTPGQFAHIALPGVFLRRPISIAGYERKNRLLRLIVQRAGRGTDILCSLPAGSELTALLPLGNPFPLDEIRRVAESGGRDGRGERDKNVWIVSGGIGIAPLLFLAGWAYESGIRLDSFAGFADREKMFAVSELEACGTCRLSTGGYVTDSIEDALKERKPELIIACGPAPMLAALQKICKKHDIAAYASFEERMGCGIGACLVCNCGFGEGSGFRYRRACIDGPVFDLSEAML